ncbi:hypothetical protein [Pelomonas sp. BJYL3]|uniref:hypothetical protein n=1 Tax=Pelomonas sp. BJYL3 TaxID=2976697 RepID=UPI0022B347E0|nr:hypothetical protein [Pelomonas sp. BJYL3]
MTPSDPGQLLDDFSALLANDPGALSTQSGYYVPNLHGTGAEDVVALLDRAIRRSHSEAQLYYFSGQRGTGKSTELRRLEILLNGQPGTRAYIVDALDYIGDTHPIDTLDLLLVIAAAFADRLSQPDALGSDQDPHESPLQRFTHWLGAEVEITGVTLGGVKAEFKKQQQSIVQRLRTFDLSRQERVMAECRQHIGQMAEAVRRRWQAPKIVLMVDSLERLRGIGKEASEMFDRVVKVFDGDMNQLRVPDLHMVYSVPPYLPYLTNIKALVQLFMLASVRVCEPPSKARRAPRATGLDAMRQVVERRCPRWRELLSEPALDRLILTSGGDLRQLLRRLLLDTLDEAAFALERLPLGEDDPILHTVVQRHRVEFESLVVQDEYALLKGIAEQNALDLRHRDELSTVAHFFDVRAVLNYRNGVDWLDLNPLLWDLIARWQPPAVAHDRGN